MIIIVLYIVAFLPNKVKLSQNNKRKAEEIVTVVPIDHYH